LNKKSPTHHSFVIGPSGEKPRSDLRATYTLSSDPLAISVTSKVQSLYGETIYSLAKEVCQTLDVQTGKLEIEDFGALPYVIMARLEALLKRAFPAITAEVLPPFKEHCQYTTMRERFRRSRLYLPGNQPKLMVNAGIHRPDGIILDLEDAVAPSEKDAARFIVRNALRTLDFFGTERMVRINQGELGLEDLAFVIPHNVHVILIPKVENADQVREIDERVQTLGQETDRSSPVFLMPIIESARGVMNALEIAEASPNNIALTIGLEDYTANLGVPRTLNGSESLWARSRLVNAARAAGLQAIDSVFSDVDDEDGLRQSAKKAKALGFEGMGCVHPRQIRPIHETFAPAEAEIEKAQAIVAAFEKAQAAGLGVVSLGSKMIDPPVVKRAQQTLALAVASGKLAPRN